MSNIRVTLSIMLFVFALILASPPVIPTIVDDVLLNFPLANYLAERFNLNMNFALILTYTLFPLLLIYMAAVIHPSSTENVFSRYIRRIKSMLENMFKKAMERPLLALIVLIAMYFLYLNLLLK